MLLWKHIVANAFGHAAHPAVTADVRKLLWPSMANFATQTLPVLQLRKLSKYSYQQTTDSHKQTQLTLVALAGHTAHAHLHALHLCKLDRCSSLLPMRNTSSTELHWPNVHSLILGVHGGGWYCLV